MQVADNRIRILTVHINIIFQFDNMFLTPHPLPRDEYSEHVFRHVIVKRTLIRARNKETREWALFSKKFIRAGTFLGFYTGEFVKDVNTDSFYAAEMGRGLPSILPFTDERKITSAERSKHPFASANEPSAGEHANMHLEIQDFSSEEVDHAREVGVGKSKKVFFYRGLAFFACVDIERNQQLTWQYGDAYTPNRRLKRYEAGFPCKKVLDKESFIQEASRSVLDAIKLVPHTCAYRVTSNVQSVRFNKKKRVRMDSDGDESVASSSGSGHETAYVPRPSSRRKK